MNRIGTIYLLALTSLAALNAAALEARPSPYDKIAERNLFRLQPPLQASVNNPVPKPPLRKIRLTGIATILARGVAFITIEGAKAQQPESFMVVEGQGVNGIELKGIDERAGVVRIVNDGETQWLNFEIVSSSGPPPTGCPLPPTGSPPVPVGADSALTPEEQAALIELQRIKFKMEGNPIQTILPPTEVTSEINDKDAATP